jgi:glycerophosphoryl diester phosphodiesterase
MTLTIAHRGEPVGHPENTLPAFEAAVRAGADMVELDVRLTGDGVPVLLHDAGLQRIWERDALLSQLTADDLAQLPGPSGERVPTLAEAARLITDAGRQIMVDLPDPEAIPAAHTVLDGLGLMDACLFAGRARTMRSEMPTARIALSWDDITPPAPAILEYYQPEYFNPHFQLLTAGIADAMHARGIGVSVWTVDHPRDMAAVITQGADAVITNKIADLIAIVAGQAAEGPAR